MRFSTASALFFAASIAVAIAYPSRRYYGPVSYDEDEYPGGKDLWTGRGSYSLGSAPFYFQARNLELEEAGSRARKYTVVKKKKDQVAPTPVSDEEEEEPQDEEDAESSEEDEEQDEEKDQDQDEESFDIPPWQELFPEEDKNTGSFNDQPSGGYGGQGQQGQVGYGGQGQQGQGGSLAGIPGGAPAPESGGSLMNFFSGSGGSGGGSSGNSGGGPQGGGYGGPGQYRQGPPPYRARTAIGVEEPRSRSGGAVLYDGYRYIPVKPVHVRLQQREAKKIKPKQQQSGQGRSLKPAPKPRQNKKLSTNTNKKYVLVPVQRDNREIRFSRDDDGFRVESGPMYAPTEIWRWEGAGGPPLRRRDNRPAGLYYVPRPPRGSTSSVRFAQENDY